MNRQIRPVVPEHHRQLPRYECGAYFLECSAVVGNGEDFLYRAFVNADYAFVVDGDTVASRQLGLHLVEVDADDSIRLVDDDALARIVLATGALAYNGMDAKVYKFHNHAGRHIRDTEYKLRTVIQCLVLT